MSLKINIISNYASQIYVSFIGILILPLYIKYMGEEPYGLIAFYSMMQSWFNLLDMGLSPTLARQVARYNGGALSATQYRSLFSILEIFFIFVGFIGGCGLFISSNYIAHNWIKPVRLLDNEILLSLQLIALTVATRWIGSIYRGVITGSEKFSWLAGFNITIATIRFVLILPIIIYFDSSISTYFSYQVCVAFLELTGLFISAKRLLPRLELGQNITYSISAVKEILGFSLSISFTTTVWIIATQTDKLFLSKILSLSDYGHFTLAVLAASGINMIAGPISAAIMPRMANLEAQNKRDKLIELYRASTQFISIIAGATAITLALDAKRILYVWTDNYIIAENAAPILFLYALGNGFVAVSAFPFYLQYAKGNLRLHLIGNAMYALLIVPLAYFSANYYQGIGVGYVWLGLNILSFSVWPYLVHKKFAPEISKKWYLEDVLFILIPTLIVGKTYFNLMHNLEGRILNLLIVIAGELLLLIVGLSFSSSVRFILFNKMQRWIVKRKY